jgi:hypothetical protein
MSLIGWPGTEMAACHRGRPVAGRRRCAYSRTVPDVVDMSPGRFAALIAPVMERRTLAVGTRAMARGASALTAPGGVPPGARRMFGQLRTALLARKVPTASLAAIYRYRDAGDVRRDLEDLRAAGLIDTTGDGAIQATGSGRVVLAEMYKVSADVAAGLWAGQKGSLASLSNLAGRVADAALVTGGDAYLAMAPPYEPAGAASGLRCIRLSVLRYHRADAHAAAW